MRLLLILPLAAVLSFTPPRTFYSKKLQSVPQKNPSKKAFYPLLTKGSTIPKSISPAPVLDAEMRLTIAERVEKNKSMLTTLVGVIFTVLTLFSFASPDGGLLPTLLSESTEIETTGDLAEKLSGDSFIEAITTAFGEVFSITLPGSPADVAALTLGEGLSGFFSSSLVFGVRAYMMRMMNKESTNAGVETDMGEIVTNSDFFLARGVAQSLGAGPFASVLAAVVPSTMAKVNDRRIVERKRLLEELEQEEEARRNSSWLDVFRNDKKISTTNASGYNKFENDVDKTLNEGRQSKLNEKKKNLIDTVEISGDVTKWLEYEVLQKDLGSKIIPGDVGLESGLFGFVASLSSLMYIDFCHKYLRLGSEEEIARVDNRSTRETVSRYLENGVSSFFLFGIYAALRLPINKSLLEVFSGGVDSCLGSANYELCSSTFLLDNEPPSQLTIQDQVHNFGVFFEELLTRVGLFIGDSSGVGHF